MYNIILFQSIYTLYIYTIEIVDTFLSKTKGIMNKHNTCNTV